ncbi:MAG: hypothetical protein H0U86_17325, partial [Chloroflexi bacterium]|nr:hypothetical protein [Chloroflexota bacterium]
MTLWSSVLGGPTKADAAEDLFGQSLAAAEEIGDRMGAARAHRGLGMVLGVARDDPAGAVPVIEKALA